MQFTWNLRSFGHTLSAETTQIYHIHRQKLKNKFLTTCLHAWAAAVSQPQLSFAGHQLLPPHQLYLVTNGNSFWSDTWKISSWDPDQEPNFKMLWVCGFFPCSLSRLINMSSLYLFSIYLQSLPKPHHYTSHFCMWTIWQYSVLSSAHQIRTERGLAICNPFVVCKKWFVFLPEELCFSDFSPTSIQNRLGRANWIVRQP